MGGEFCVAAVFGSSRSWFANNPGLKREKGWCITKIKVEFQFPFPFAVFSHFVAAPEKMYFTFELDALKDLLQP